MGNWNGFYWVNADKSYGFERAAGWYTSPATENHDSKEQALDAARKFGRVTVAYNHETGEGQDFARGFMQGYKLARGETYMYDSSRRILELQKLNNEDNDSAEYAKGFAAAVYSLFRC